MQIYSAIITKNPEGFAEAVEREFPSNFLKVSPNAWYLAGQGTAQEVATRLGMVKTDTYRPTVSGIINTVVGYYGFAGVNIWEWLATKQQADG